MQFRKSSIFACVIILQGCAVNTDVPSKLSEIATIETSIGVNLPEMECCIRTIDSYAHQHFHLMAGPGIADGALLIQLKLSNNAIGQMLEISPWGIRWIEGDVKIPAMARLMLKEDISSIMDTTNVKHAVRHSTEGSGELLIFDQSNCVLTYLKWDS